MSRKNVGLGGKLITSDDPLLIGGGQGEEPANFRQLTNMRYEDQNPKGIQGHTKINATALATYLKTRNGFHYKKDFIPSANETSPSAAESHVVVQSENTGETASKIWQNTTAIPGAGNFSLNYSSAGHTSDAIHTDTANGGLGRFSDAPSGFLAYANGAETMVWGGDEARVASFIRYDPNDNTKKWDYTDQIANNLTTDVATLVKSGGATDANEVLLLHMDGIVASQTFTDSSTLGGGSPHTITANGDAQLSDAQRKFGDTSGLFDGTGDYLSFPGHDDFDLSGGTFTIDCWVRFDSAGTIYYQEGADNNNYTRIYISGSSPYFFNFDIYKTAGAQLTLQSASSYATDTWTHVAVVGDGTDCYLFVNGVLSDSATPTSFPGDWGDGAGNPIYIGNDYNTFTADIAGYMDEFRILKGTAAWTSAFAPATSAYPVNKAEVYLGSILPIQGVKLYVGTANTAVSTAEVRYWSGSEWTSVSNIVDTTESPAGDSLGQTGTISFDDTSSVAKPSSVDRQFLYWYKLSFPDLDDTTTIYHATVDVPWQSMKDIWDGTYRTNLMAIEWNEALQTYSDHTTATFEDRYESTDESSFAELSFDPWVAADDYIIFGFTERQAGMVFDIVSGKENVVTAAMDVQYWGGDGWLSVGTLNDNTVQDGKSLGKSGSVTWNPPTIGSEFKRQDLGTRRVTPLRKFIAPFFEPQAGRDPTKSREQANDDVAESVKKQPYAMAQLDYPLHVYRVSFNGAIEADPVDQTKGVQIYHVGGISAQNDLKDYVFPSLHQNRLFLSNNTSQHKNEEICSATGTVNVFNGEDATRFKYGGEGALTASTTMYTQYRDQLSSIRAVFKADETWILFGGSPDTWRKIQVSDRKGCVAPLTLQRVDVGSEAGVIQVCIFQGANGIHMFDGKTVIDIHNDIRDVFDDGTINSSEIDNSASFYNPARQEYHWLWSSGSNTDHDQEYVFDVRRFKWYTIERGTGAYLQCGYTVEDTDGNNYNYGMIDTGHAVRTGNGTTFAKTTDANEIAHTMWLGDFVPDVGAYVQLRDVNITAKAKTETDEVTLSHYRDTSTTASATIPTISQVNSGKRLYDEVRSVNQEGYSHSLKFQVTTGSETTGFEPLALSLNFDKKREKQGR